MFHKKLSFSFLGDTSLTFAFDEKPFSAIERLLCKSDFVVCNLEGPVTQVDHEPPIPCYTSEKYIKEFQAANIRYFSLANNHTTDLGESGLIYTLKTLTDRRLRYLGAGLNISEALKPMLLNDGVCILSFGSELIDCKRATDKKYGVAPLYKKLISQMLRRAKKHNKVVIIILHFGYERDILPTPYDRSLCHKLIENGADLIVGHHPHYFQGHESHMGKDIFYSLGNFAFADIATPFLTKPWESEALFSFILQWQIDLKTLKANWSIVPIKSESGSVIPLMGEEKRILINEFNNRSECFARMSDRKYHAYWKQNAKRKLVNPSGVVLYDKIRNSVYKMTYTAKDEGWKAMVEKVMAYKLRKFKGALYVKTK